MSRAVAAAIASMIRRRFCGRSCLSLFDQLRPCSTQALTQGIEQNQSQTQIQIQTTNSGNLDASNYLSRQALARGSNSINRGIGGKVPLLLVPSRIKSQCCSLFSLSRSTEDGKERNFINFERDICLPETAPVDTAICIGSSEGFLFYTPTSDSTEIFAFDPLTRLHLPLPPSSTLRQFPDELTGLTGLSQGKALLSPSGDIVVLNRVKPTDFARLDSKGGGCWTPLPAKDGFGRIHDFIFHKGLLYAVDLRGIIGIFDFDNPSSDEPGLPPSLISLSGNLAKGNNFYFRSSLVESPDGKDLFLVYRHIKRWSKRWTRFFKVYKLNQVGKWTRVKSIGDIAIFVGTNQSISLSARDFPHILKPNSIYFTENWRLSSSTGPWAVRDTGIFSLDDRSIHYFECPSGREVLDWLIWSKPSWFTPTTTV